MGVQGRPPQLQVVTGLVRGETTLPRYDDYKVVILQQPYGRDWLRLINSLRERGIKVLYEIDDYVHGIPKQKGHSYQRAYTKQVLVGYEICMRACDGLVVSTEYLARRYARFNRNIYLCRNGLDVARYDLTRPARERCNIGWAGASGHAMALLPWLNELMPLLREREDSGFVCIGEPHIAQVAGQIVGEERTIGVPFVALECYPAAMCLFDIALAPAQDTTWYRGKSDLRWLEASALGIPVIADANVYPEIEHGVTGFHATVGELTETVRMLLDDDQLRRKVGEQAREHVLRERSIEALAPQWFEVASAVVGGYESVSQVRRA